MEQRACATNVPSRLHLSRGYSSIKYRSNSANDPNARQPNLIDDVAIGDWKWEED